MAKHKYFTAHKNPPFISNEEKIKTTGVYFIRDYSRRDSNAPTLFFLYSDGTVRSAIGAGISGISEAKFWSTPEHYMQELRMNTIGSPGHFWIRGEKIVIQIFHINPGALFSINSVEFRGEIINDSAFVVTSSFCKWCHSTIPNYKKQGIAVYRQEYRFYRTDIRPDSTAIWFKSKKWYKDNVWNGNEE